MYLKLLQEFEIIMIYYGISVVTLTKMELSIFIFGDFNFWQIMSFEFGAKNEPMHP